MKSKWSFTGNGTGEEYPLSKLRMHGFRIVKSYRVGYGLYKQDNYIVYSTEFANKSNTFNRCDLIMLEDRSLFK